jgi:outer membrane lipoprotein-sorting protein
MRKIIICYIALLLLIPFAVHAGELTGRQIIELQKERHAVKSDTADIVMLLVDRRGNKKQRFIQRYDKEVENGLKRALIVFKEPKDIAGTSLLTWELEGGKDKQWLYLPAQKKMQRIAGHSKKGAFMGTDFTYEDLQPDTIENYNYNLLDSEKVDKEDCYVIEITPATKEKQKESSYSRRVVWVRKDIVFTVKIEFYDRRDRLLKTQTNHDLINIEGSIWMAKKSLMSNHKKRHKTLMGVKDRKINIFIDDTVFTERFILSGKHIR